MSRRTDYIPTLPGTVQDLILGYVKDALTGYGYTAADDLVADAMNGRVCDLESLIDTDTLKHICRVISLATAGK